MNMYKKEKKEKGNKNRYRTVTDNKIKEKY